ncbi:hypothetical protein L873DRAFT_193867 [Choiromyces venosus 120613-1]|uniref:Uncharacterized protein n=1 Tax=Choiromyces venosus 120613-1 TaxID=1336337 RepID=A0A3N4J737_9PEZI|nr:hypothetical protein L873DRAFT_193867 [Choiromyces venosus 120613-1]
MNTNEGMDNELYLFFLFSPLYITTNNTTTSLSTLETSEKIFTFGFAFCSAFGSCIKGQILKVLLKLFNLLLHLRYLMCEMAFLLS